MCHTRAFTIDPDLTTLSISAVAATDAPSIKIYATPVTGIIKFEIEDFSNKIYSFQIYTNEGKLITHRILKDGYQEVDIRTWSTRINLLQCIDPDHTQIETKKIFVK